MRKEYVVGLGDNVVDYYNNQNVKYPGGNAVNFSVFAPKDLVDSYYVGSVANDPDGDLILESLRQEKVHTGFCNRIDGQTEKTFVNIVKGDRKFLDSVKGKRKLPSLENPQLLEMLGNALTIYSGCHANSESAVEKLHKMGKTIAFDFSEMLKYHQKAYLEQVAKNVDIAQFSMSDSTPEDLEKLVKTCADLGTRFVLFTNGGEPPLLVDCKQNKRFVGKVNYDPDPVDTMGAGDTFFANMVVYLLIESKSLARITDDRVNASLDYAAKAAARTIRQNGSFGHGMMIRQEV